MTIQKTLALVLVAGAVVTNQANAKFYVGADAGYSQTKANQKGSMTVNNTTYSGKANKNTPKGFDGAFRLGFLNNKPGFLWGFETSLGYAFGSSSKTTSMQANVGKVPATLTLKSKITRGLTTDVITKLGGKFNQTSVYGLVGIAFAQFKENISVNLQTPGNNTFGKNNHTKMLTGITYGAGLMQDINEKVSAKIEYRHTQYETLNNKFAGNNGLKVNAKIKPVTDAFMAGVVYHL